MARSAIVTGGTRGIGEAISVILKEAGISVSVSYISNDERARAFTMRTGIYSFKWDVADYDACQRHGKSSPRSSSVASARQARLPAP